jgi:cob(I)alamin adenosyltransferase
VPTIVSDSTRPRIYTKTGDAGETGLFDGTRVSKADARVDAYGDVDELAAWLGLARGRLVDADLAAMLTRIQIELFAVGARLADPRRAIAARVEKSDLGPAHIATLEADIDRLEAGLPPLRRFILPGGVEAGAALHVARTVCRRAERKVVSLAHAADTDVVIYLNRLSDLLFVMARTANHRAGVPETEW